MDIIHGQPIYRKGSMDVVIITHRRPAQTCLHRLKSTTVHAITDHTDTCTADVNSETKRLRERFNQGDCAGALCARQRRPGGGHEPQ